MKDNRQNPSASLGLVILFLLAVGVFIGTAFLCKWMLVQFIENQDLRTGVSFIIAGGATLVFLKLLKFVNRTR